MLLRPRAPAATASGPAVEGEFEILKFSMSFAKGTSAKQSTRHNPAMTGGLTPKTMQHFTTPQHGNLSKSAYVKNSTLQAPQTGPVKSMRVLGKENEELQQYARELNEALKSSNESKNTLVANHEVQACCIFLKTDDSNR